MFVDMYEFTQICTEGWDWAFLEKLIKAHKTATKRAPRSDFITGLRYQQCRYYQLLDYYYHCACYCYYYLLQAILLLLLGRFV